MKLNNTILLLILISLFVVSCTPNDIDYDSQPNFKDTINEINKNEPKLTLEDIDKLYQKFHSLNYDNIDCNNSDFFDTDLMNFSLFPFDAGDSPTAAKPTRWYPSLKKGYISWLVGEVKNVGCTEIDLAYFSVIVFNDKILYLSQTLEEDSDFDYGIYLPQQEKMVSFSPIATKYTTYAFEITEEGKYTVFIFLKNLNTNNIVGVEKYLVDTSQWI